MSLFIVGLGPGGPEHRTAAAERAVREADVVIGYGPYVDQCADLLDGQEVVRGTMGEELERAREAVERARDARVALVSSGDAGVHGMAARTLAMADGHRRDGRAGRDRRARDRRRGSAPRSPTTGPRSRCPTCTSRWRPWSAA